MEKFLRTWQDQSYFIRSIMNLAYVDRIKYCAIYTFAIWIRVLVDFLSWIASRQQLSLSTNYNEKEPMRVRCSFHIIVIFLVITQVVIIIFALFYSVVRAFTTPTRLYESCYNNWRVINWSSWMIHELHEHHEHLALYSRTRTHPLSVCK